MVILCTFASMWFNLYLFRRAEISMSLIPHLYNQSSWSDDLRVLLPIALTSFWISLGYLLQFEYLEPHPWKSNVLMEYSGPVKFSVLLISSFQFMKYRRSTEWDAITILPKISTSNSQLENLISVLVFKQVFSMPFI